MLSLPLFLAFIIGLVYLMTYVHEGNIRLGIVDPAGFLRVTSLDGREDIAQIIVFETAEAAEVQLMDEKNPLTAVYYLPEDYPNTIQIEMVYTDWPSSDARDYFTDLLRYNLLAGQPEALVNRVIEGQHLTFHATEYNREFADDRMTADMFIPLGLSVMYIFTIVPVASIMLGALGEEKVNRTIEVIMTSISPKQMITGKILAVSGIALLQVSIWLIFAVLAIWVSSTWFDMEFFQNIQVRWRDVLALVLLAIPGYLFYSSALVMLGSVIDDEEALQQAGGLVFIPLFLPMYVLPILMEQPESVVATVFSILPITSVQTVGLQSTFFEVPTWRIWVSAGSSMLIALGTIWLASRAFRMGMLRYGKRIRIFELFGKAASAR